VLYLFSAIFYKLARDHAIWHVAAHAQPASMSGLHNSGNKFRLGNETKCAHWLESYHCSMAQRMLVGTRECAHSIVDA
jgi:hypothetical protein